MKRIADESSQGDMILTCNTDGSLFFLPELCRYVLIVMSKRGMDQDVSY